jgi:polygalacturonase
MSAAPFQWSGARGGAQAGAARLAGLAALLSCASLVHAQDTRHVTEPVAPPVCVVLTADGAKDDTARIQAAIDHCAPGHAVRLSAASAAPAASIIPDAQRDFLSAPLTLRSGVSLLIDAGAVLYATTDPRAYDRGAGTCGSIDKLGKGCKPFITITAAKGSGIYGAGVIDGQGGHVMDGKSESFWQLSRRAQKEDARQNVPRLIEITQSQDITLHQVTLRNSAMFHVTLNQVDGFTAWGVRLDTPATARNTDGIDPISSRNVTIAHSIIRTGDDNIAIKAGTSGPAENISVLHNRFYNGHGMSIGSETNGGVRKVLVEDLTMDGATSGLRIKSDISRGGIVDGVVYRNVCLRNVKAPIDFATRYNPKASGTLIPDYRNIVLDQVRSVTPGRVIAQGYDARHPVRATLRKVAIDRPEQQLEHATFEGGLADAGAPDCAQRFAPFPEAGTSRPQLELSQAKRYEYGEVLKYVGLAGAERADPWDPLSDPLAKGTAYTPRYTVDSSARGNGTTTFTTVQAAISRALEDGAAHPQDRSRIHILVKPGVYRELVYIPADAAPITLYGEGASAAETKITAKLDAAVTGTSYTAQYGPQFASAHPAVQAMHSLVRDRATISTSGSMTVWVKNNGFQARNITIENGYNKDVGNAREECGERPCGRNDVNPQQGVVHHQAVALLVEGADKVQFENIRLIGFQDTLYLKSAEVRNTVRSFFNKSYIEGDVDFIFGDTTAYFHQTEIRSLGDRSTSYVGAPNTNVKTRYGFVFDNCRFTHDGSPNALAGQFYLARQWFHNQRCTPYGKIPVEGYSCTLGDVSVYPTPKGTITPTVLETVGKMAVLNSRIGSHIRRAQPWSDWNRNGTLSYRPAQFNSSDFWTNLQAAGIDPVKDLGYGKAPEPADPFLVEFNNANE